MTYEQAFDAVAGFVATGRPIQVAWGTETGRLLAFHPDGGGRALVADALGVLGILPIEGLRVVDEALVDEALPRTTAPRRDVALSPSFESRPGVPDFPVACWSAGDGPQPARTEDYVAVLLSRIPAVVSPKDADRMWDVLPAICMGLREPGRAEVLGVQGGERSSAGPVGTLQPVWSGPGTGYVEGFVVLFHGWEHPPGLTPTEVDDMPTATAIAVACAAEQDVTWATWLYVVVGVEPVESFASSAPRWRRR